MSRKFFSLIHGGKVHVAPKTKVIPAEEFSTLQSAKEVLKKVKEDAEIFKKEIIAEIETYKEQAQREGFEAGFQAWAEKIAELETEIANVRKDMEQKVLPVSIQAAKKIVNKEIELSEKAIVDIVSSNLKAVAQHKRITIYVNPADLNTLEANRSHLKDLFESLEALSIRPRQDVSRGGCVIETESGIINAQIENRWRILEAAFERLVKTK